MLFFYNNSWFNYCICVSLYIPPHTAASRRKGPSSKGSSSKYRKTHRVSTVFSCLFYFSLFIPPHPAASRRIPPHNPEMISMYFFLSFPMVLLVSQNFSILTSKKHKTCNISKTIFLIFFLTC